MMPNQFNSGSNGEKTGEKVRVKTTGGFIRKQELLDALLSDWTWLERQGVTTLTMVDAKQRTVNIIDSCVEYKADDDALVVLEDSI